MMRLRGLTLTFQVPNIYVKKPHRKQPALGLFLAKADPADREDWRLTTGGDWPDIRVMSGPPADQSRESKKT